MASYKSFAIVGVGSLGTFVVDELLKGQVAVKILTRDASKVQTQCDHLCTKELRD